MDYELELTKLTNKISTLFDIYGDEENMPEAQRAELADLNADYDYFCGKAYHGA